MGVKLTTEMIQAAQDTQNTSGVPASVTLAQIILESGGSNEGGLSDLAYKYKNLFGITKGDSWDGETITLSNKAGNDTKTYRVYNSFLESIADHAKVLLNERYRKYTRTATSVDDYVDGIAKGGYAEDPNYASKLKQIIKDHNLTAYDDDNKWILANSSASTSDIEAHLDKKTSGEVDLKWWGDILVFALCSLLLVGSLVFFISSFSSANNAVDEVKKVTKKATSKGKEVVSMVRKKGGGQNVDSGT